jgi:hypothetical protein
MGVKNFPRELTKTALLKLRKKSKRQVKALTIVKLAFGIKNCTPP